MSKTIKRYKLYAEYIKKLERLYLLNFEAYTWIDEKGLFCVEYWKE